MATFIPGMKLCEQFFNEIVKVLLRKRFPGLRYSAGLIDYGSEVLGFDTERSTDHDWGPRVNIFLSQDDIRKIKSILNYLYKNRPSEYRGYSTYFSETYDTDVSLTGNTKDKSEIERNDLPSCFEIYTIRSFFKKYLLLEINKEISVSDWLTFPEQKLRAIRSGKIFFDLLDLRNIRKSLHYFPKDIWMYMLASEWTKIGQEEPFIGRTGEMSDELGSKLIASRIIHSIMKLCFLMEKEYAPYSKWFGTAFTKLKCADELSPVFNKALSSEKWKEREKHLSKAYKIIVRMHNEMKITEPVSTDLSMFYNRPYFIIRGRLIANCIRKQIKDPDVKNISDNIGSVNQFTNTVDLLGNEALLKRLKVLYE